MRCLAVVALVTVTGCNWIFGLEPTIALDASPPGEALPPGLRTKLVWAIATSDGTNAADGIDPVVTTAGIGSEPTRPGVPVILVGDEDGLEPAPYDVGDGSFEIPYRLRESPHRIVYTLPNESVSHEVQWSITGATIVIPRATRLDALPPPDGSGYSISPMNFIGSLAVPSLYTSGVMTAATDVNDFEQAGGTVTFRFATKGRPLAGPLGAPQAALGDWVLLADWAQRTQNQASIDGWALTSVELVEGAMSVPQTEPPWQSAETTLSPLPPCPTDPSRCLPGGNAAATDDRIVETLGGLAGSVTTARLAYGISPSTQLQGFLPGPPPSFVEQPLMLMFAESALNDSSITLADPSPSLAYKRVVYSHVGRRRTVDGVDLTTSINSITDVMIGTMQYPAPLVFNVTLGGVALSGSASADNTPVAATSGMVTLGFEQESGHTADDFVVTLYEIVGTSLVPVRHYHVLGTSVRVDGSLLVLGHEYVFGITARTGFSKIGVGNYTEAKYPFGSTTTFPRTFVVQ